MSAYKLPEMPLNERPSCAWDSDEVLAGLLRRGDWRANASLLSALDHVIAQRDELRAVIRSIRNGECAEVTLRPAPLVILREAKPGRHYPPRELPRDRKVVARP